jgi:subtilisin-like proprotein convertase family protein
VTSSAITIKVNITHTWDGDLDLILEAPSGDKLGLCYHVGSSGDNFTNTIFSDGGATVVPATGAPYTGTYKPWASTFTGCITGTVTSFASIGGGSINPNGTWKLHVHDGAAQDVGTINNWSITFPATSPQICSSNSNAIAVIVNNAPAITTFSPLTGAAGSAVTVNGSNFNTVTAVKINGVNAVFAINNNNQLTATIPAGATTGLITVINPCGTANSASAYTVTTSSATLNLVVFIQGFYIAPATMNGAVSPSVCDTVMVKLANASAPYAFTDSVRSTISVNGTGVFIFPATVLGSSHYIIVKHRNSLETWSSSPVSFVSSPVSYNFSDAISKAYGNNMKPMGGNVFAIYSGDVNQDGAIESADYSEVENAIQQFIFVYHKDDITGDDVVESADYGLLENNVQLFIFIARP